jgi:hypothetical protein
MFWTFTVTERKEIRAVVGRLTAWALRAVLAREGAPQAAVFKLLARRRNFASETLLGVNIA